MSPFAHDQAEGLRRLLAPDFVRIVTVASGRPGIGKATAVLNLAAMLAQRGKKVLIIDERPVRGSADPSVFPPVRHDLAAVLRGRKALPEIIVEGPPGIRLLHAHEAMRHLAELDPTAQEKLSAAFGHLAQSVDIVLVDPAPGTGHGSLSLSLAAQELLLLVSGDPRSITDAYALMKRLARDFAQRRFHVVVNKAKGAADAEAIYSNIAEVAGRYLKTRLEYLGHVPLDGQVKQAAKLGQTVIDAFPASPAVGAFRALAERIETWPYPADEAGRLEAFLHKLVITSRLTAEGAHL
jgi:flagellar biosynthesis protein FlhG